MAKWARRGRRHRRGGWPVSMYYYADQAAGAAQATPDPYTHDEPEAIVTALVQLEVSKAIEENQHDAG